MIVEHIENYTCRTIRSNNKFYSAKIINWRVMSFDKNEEAKGRI